jgi:SAM-dependent methyltransferase
VQYGADLAAGYELVFGRLAERTWRQGVLAELARIGVPAGGLVADLGAGTGIGGRLLRTLAQGARRLGIDRSESMLRLARQWYDGTVLGDAADPPVRTGSADVVVSGFDSMNYLDPEALRRCLHGVSRCLIPGGWLVFDYSSPALVRRRFGRDQEVPGGIVHIRHRYEPDANYAVSLVEWWHDGGRLRWRERHRQYALDREQLHHLATAAGLSVVRVRNLTGPEFSPRANAHVWLLRKP